MLLVITAFALVASVPLAGGRLTALADIRPQAVWAVLLAAAIQVAITTFAAKGSHSLHAALHIFSYVLDAYFVFANRRLSGIPVVALGAGMNLLAIAVNAGVMPASAAAIRISGLARHAGFDNSASLAHAHLAFLGDVIPVPGPWPIGNVLSVGDLIIFTGALLVLHRACGSGKSGSVPQRTRLPTGRIPYGNSAPPPVGSAAGPVAEFPAFETTTFMASPGTGKPAG